MEPGGTALLCLLLLSHHWGSVDLLYGSAVYRLAHTLAVRNEYAFATVVVYVLEAGRKTAVLETPYFLMELRNQIVYFLNQEVKFQPRFMNFLLYFS